MTLFQLILFGALCFYLGYKTHQMIFKHIVIPVLKELGITEDSLKSLLEKVKKQGLKAEDNRPEITIKVEQHEGLFYAYRRDTNQYLCRAKTTDLLREELSTVLPLGHKITILKNEGAEYFN